MSHAGRTFSDTRRIAPWIDADFCRASRSARLLPNNSLSMKPRKRRKSSLRAEANSALGTVAAGEADVAGHTLMCTFTRKGETWKVYEDLRTRDGNITFISAQGLARVLTRNAEETFAAEGPQHLGLDIKDIGMSGPGLAGRQTASAWRPDREGCAQRCTAHELRA